MLYPNLVTLSATGVEEQRRRIRDLRDSLAGCEWAVKDSFDTLRLEPDGFQRMFHARWMTLAAVDNEESGDGVLRVETPQQLEVWESAWCTHTGHDQAVSPFRAALLDDPDVAVLVVWQDSQPVGGLIANRGGGVVGVTNMFAGRGSWQLMGQCLAVAEKLWPKSCGPTFR